MTFSLENLITIAGITASVVEAIWIYSQKQSLGRIYSDIASLSEELKELRKDILTNGNLERYVQNMIFHHKETCKRDGVA